MNQRATAPNCRGNFIVGIVEGEFVFVFFINPQGDPENQVKAFKTSKDNVEQHVHFTQGIGMSLVQNENAFLGVRLERAWYPEMSGEMQHWFRRFAKVEDEKHLVWPQDRPALKVA